MRIALSSSNQNGSASNGRTRGGGRGVSSGRGDASGRGSSVSTRSKKSCRISMSSQTTDINQEQEQQEQDIPEQDPNRVVEDGEAGDVEMEDSVDEDLYERGPALMPPVPREEDKVVLTPVGDR